MNIDKEMNFDRKTVAFLTLGCKVNSYETEAMQKIFEDAGYRVVDFSMRSDVYVVNTCTVTNIADRKSRQMLHKARKMNDDAVVVAVGCYVQTAGEVLKQDAAIDIVIGNNKKKDIIRILNEYYTSGYSENRCITDKADDIDNTYNTDKADDTDKTYNIDKADNTGKTYNIDKADDMDKTYNIDKAENTDKTYNIEKAENTDKTYNMDKAHNTDAIKAYTPDNTGKSGAEKKTADQTSPADSLLTGTITAQNKNRTQAKLDNILDIDSETEYEELNIDSVAEKTRAYIKIQDGCNQFCSYCIIPYARGRVRSRGEESILTEVKNLVSKGYKEIVLTGIHLSSYGIDFEPVTGKHRLLELVLMLSQVEGLKRIRFGSLEPRIITEEFVQTLSDNTKICPHFHLSLQSGCDATLKRMNRKYSTQEYYDKCVLLRKYFNNPAITTDVIVGFPGETEEDFEETYNFLKKVSFAQMHIFKYSVRKGTRAEHMPDQVRDETKTARSNRLMELEENMASKYKTLFSCREEKILIEEAMNINGVTYQAGHNERYIKMAVKSNQDLINSIVKVKVAGFLKKDIMFCEIMD